jgi:putative aminopeptidase FrvX
MMIQVSQVMELYKKLQFWPLVSSYEDKFFIQFFSFLEEEFPDLEIKKSGLNILVFPKDNSKIKSKVLVAHYDEVGLIVDKQISLSRYRARIVGVLNLANLFGKVFETVFDGKRIQAICLTPPAHNEEFQKSIFLDLLEPLDIPANYPFSFQNGVIETLNSYFGRAFDNRIGVAVSILAAKEFNFPVVLSCGEETGTTRFKKTLEEIEVLIPSPIYLVIDATFSSSDPYCESEISDGEVAFLVSEANGKGNVASKTLIDSLPQLKQINTYGKHDTTDASNLKFYGKESIALVYPISSMHSNLEKIEKKTIGELIEFLTKM